MTDNTYNGWTNWDTWNVALWMDNEQEWYELYAALMRGLNAGRYNEDDVTLLALKYLPKQTPDGALLTYRRVWEKVMTDKPEYR